MTNFVIVHGAWAGAWAWARVAKRLRDKGHAVHVPTLSGLGERSHLAQVRGVQKIAKLKMDAYTSSSQQAIPELQSLSNSIHVQDSILANAKRY